MTDCGVNGLYEVVQGDLLGEGVMKRAKDGEKVVLFPVEKHGQFHSGIAVPPNDFDALRRRSSKFAKDHAPNHGQKVDAYQFVGFPVKVGRRNLLRVSVFYYTEA